MKRKKIFAIALAVLSAACLAACGDPSLGDGDGEGGDGTGITVTFDAGVGAFANGKTNVKYKVGDDGKAAIDKSPVRDGYAFAGWYNGNVEFDPNKEHTVNTTYKATYISGDDDRVYQTLFDENTVVSIDINMKDAEWKKLDADFERIYKSPIYRLADSVTVSIESDDFTYDFYYKEVGVRMKGNTSRRHFYGDDGFYASVHYKLSFGETFDDEDEYSASERKVWHDASARKARKDRTFGGMEKLDLKYNKNEDPTYIKDLYAMKMFRDNDIAAPQATLCGVSALNKDESNKSLGVYTLYESVDSVFLKRYFKGDHKGDLYKCAWSGGYGANFTREKSEHGNPLYGIEDELNGKFYCYDKKTNKKVLGSDGQLDFSAIRSFIAAVNSNSQDITGVLDTEYFAKFEAINYILGNPDCIRNNYNNFYVYFRPSDGKAIFIPYDYDRCLGITKDWAPNDACLTLTPFDKRTSGNEQVNPIYTKLLLSSNPTDGGTAKQKYKENLNAIASSQALKPTEFDKLKDIYKAHYDSVAKTAIGTNNVRFDANNTGNKSYSEYITRKLEVLRDNLD